MTNKVKRPRKLVTIYSIRLIEAVRGLETVHFDDYVFGNKGYDSKKVNSQWDSAMDIYAANEEPSIGDPESNDYWTFIF